MFPNTGLNENISQQNISTHPKGMSNKLSKKNIPNNAIDFLGNNNINTTSNSGFSNKSDPYVPNNRNNPVGLQTSGWTDSTGGSHVRRSTSWAAGGSANADRHDRDMDYHNYSKY